MRGGQGGAGRQQDSTATTLYSSHGPAHLPSLSPPRRPCPDTSAPRVCRQLCGARPSAEAVSGQFGMVPPGEQNTAAADTGQRVARGGAGRGGGRRTGRCSACWTPRPRWSRPSPGRPWSCSMLVWRPGVPPRRPAPRTRTRVGLCTGLGWPGLAEPGGWDVG